MVLLSSAAVVDNGSSVFVVAGECINVGMSTTAMPQRTTPAPMYW